MRRLCGLLLATALVLVGCSGAATSGAESPAELDPSTDSSSGAGVTPEVLAERDSLRSELDDLVVRAQEAYDAHLRTLEGTEIDLATTARALFETGLVIPSSVIDAEDAIETAALNAGDPAPTRLTEALAGVGISVDASQIEGSTIALCDMVQLENCGLTEPPNPSVAHVVDSGAPSEIEFLEQAIEQVSSYLDGIAPLAAAVEADARDDIATGIRHLNRDNASAAEALRAQWDLLMADIATDLTDRTNAGRPSIGEGVHEVGTAIDSGTWVAVDVRDCTWARLRDDGSIRASERFRSASRIFVTVQASDWALELTGECVWSLTGGSSPWETPAALAAEVEELAETGQTIVVVTLGRGSPATVLRDAVREAALQGAAFSSTTTSTTTTAAPTTTAPPTATTAVPAPTTTPAPAPTTTTTDAPDTSG